MNVREIVLAHLKAGGFDGLCTEGCGCGIDDLIPCGWERDVSACVPAKRHDCDGTCGGCDGIPGDCFRPAATNEPEETHL